MKKLVLLVTGTFCLLFSANSQVTVNLNPDKDNSIYSENNNSNGTGALFSGETCGGNSRRALLHFDIAGNIPAGATITAVTLTLNVQENGGSSSSEAYNLHPVTTNWGEGTSFGTGTGAPAVFPDATWNDGMLGTPWTTAGGDFTASVATTNLTAALGNYNWSSPGMVTNVQNWLTSPATNFGWILIGNESITCTARRFGSKENGVDPILSVTYSCATPPTATCQNAVVYLGTNGLGTLTAAAIDNGSTANCGGPLNFSLSQSAFSCADIVPSSSALVLTAVFDGNLAGGLPKGVELFATQDIPDLSIYGLGSATNGGGSDGIEFAFPAVSVSAGTYIYVASESTGFNTFFGFMPDYTDSDLAVNGDDAIELFENGVVIDVFGDITWTVAQPWFYSDGFAYRVSNTGPDGSTFVIGNWTLSGVNALDPALTNSTAPIPVPIGTYTTPAFIPVTLTVTDQFANVSTCNANVIVFDTVSPTMNCIPPTTFNLDGLGNLTIGTGDIDNGTIDACGIFSTQISQTDFTCADIGLNQITLTAIDIYGNTNLCIADITIQQIGGVSITLDALNHVTCNGAADGSILTTISGGSAPFIIDWDNDGTGDFDDTDDITNLAGGTYTLVVMDQTGCMAELVATVLEPNAIDAILDTLNVICTGDSTGEIDLIVTGGTGSYTFDWDNDGTGDADDTEDLTGLPEGNYTVIIEDVNGCTALFSTDISAAYGPVDVSVTQTGLTLTANAVGSSFQWINCPGNSSVAGATNATFNPTVDGDYAVIVTNAGGCADTSSCFTILGLGIAEFEPMSLTIFPNPASDQVTVLFPFSGVQQSVAVTDANGRLVMSITTLDGSTTLDISTLETGVYFITVTTGTEISVAKFTVIH